MYFFGMAEQAFNLKFDGPALADHEIDIEDLGPSLLALSSAFQRAQLAVYPTAGPVSLKIRATSEGSFDIALALADQIDAARGLFLSEPMTMMANGLGVSTGLYTVFGGALRLVKWLGGRSIRRTDEVADGRIEITATDGSTTIVNSNVYVLVQDREFRERVRDALAPLERPGIDTMAFGPGGNDAVVNDRDLSAFNVPADTGQVLSDTVREAFLQLVSVSFKPGTKWKVAEGEGSSFFAAVEDLAFVHQVESSAVAFAKSDILKVRLRTIQRRTGTVLSVEHRIVKVLEVVRGARQVELPFDEDEHEDPQIEDHDEELDAEDEDEQLDEEEDAYDRLRDLNREDE